MTVGFNESFNLFDFKIFAVLKGQLSDDIHVNWDRVKTNDDTPIVFHINLTVPFVLSDIIYFDTRIGISVKYLGD